MSDTPTFKFDVAKSEMQRLYDENHFDAILEILGTAKQETAQPQAQSACHTWKFGMEVQCDNGHRPARPPQIAGFLIG